MDYETMAKEYLDKLNTLISQVDIPAEVSSPVEMKHFFSGAALYVNGKMCASLSPVGLAFKLPDAEVARLIDSGKAKPLKYFPKGHAKKGYALFENPDLTNTEQWRRYFVMAAQQT